MSVNITFKTINEWESIANGDFLLLEGTTTHPIPNGLYRAFIISPDIVPTDIVPTDSSTSKPICLVPLFDGPFEKNMFPYMLDDTFPKLIKKIKSVNIDAEV